jgi:predicted  nucleic acid-binding Zn-ribbon protein
VEDGMEEHDTKHDKLKKTTEKIWDSTRKTLHAATFQANKYKRIVQKKIDLASLHKKISSAHSELGKLIDDIRESGATDILAKNEVQELFQKLDTFKSEAAELEQEIEAVKMEEPPPEEEAAEENREKTDTPE